MPTLRPDQDLIPAVSTLGESNMQITLFIAYFLNLPNPLVTASGRDVYAALEITEPLATLAARGNDYYDRVSPNLRQFARQDLPACDSAMQTLATAVLPLASAGTLNADVRGRLLAALGPVTTALDTLQATLGKIQQDYAGFEVAAGNATAALNRLYAMLAGDASQARGLSPADVAAIRQSLDATSPTLQQDAQLSIKSGAAMADCLTKANNAFAAIGQSAATLAQDIADLRADLFTAPGLATDDLRAAQRDWSDLRHLADRIGF